MDQINYLLIVVSAFAAVASPGPATLAIASTSMSQGRFQGLALVAGILTGSLLWSVSAAFGVAAVLQGNAWLFEVLRYFGAMYLLFLAFKSLCSALSKKPLALPAYQTKTAKRYYLKGLLIHLTNPKAILFFAALYSIAVPATAEPFQLLSVVLTVAAVSASVFLSYALLFSHQAVSQGYIRLKVVFESIFALFFGAAGCQLLFSGVARSQ